MRTIRTPENQAVFLEGLMETASVTESIKLAGICRTAVYAWRREDEEFKQAWEEALSVGMDVLEAEAIRRAHRGVEEPVFYQGVVCGTVQKYSDVLMIFLLKGGKPEKYRERYEGRIGNVPGESIVMSWEDPPPPGPEPDVAPDPA